MSLSSILILVAVLIGIVVLVPFVTFIRSYVQMKAWSAAIMDIVTKIDLTELTRKKEAKDEQEENPQ